MGISFWRSFTHWIGGMGVLVFVMMITSLDDENAMPLMRAEVPGPEADKLVPKARHTARLLYGMYFVLTAAEVVFLLFGGMNLYDALLHAFSTAGTGGFSNRAASVSFYDSAYIDGVITVFMILSAMHLSRSVRLLRQPDLQPQIMTSGRNSRNQYYWHLCLWEPVQDPPEEVLK